MAAVGTLTFDLQNLCLFPSQSGRFLQLQVVVLILWAELNASRNYTLKMPPTDASWDQTCQQEALMADKVTERRWHKEMDGRLMAPHAKLLPAEATGRKSSGSFPAVMVRCCARGFKDTTAGLLVSPTGTRTNVSHSVRVALINVSGWNPLVT